MTEHVSHDSPLLPESEDTERNMFGRWPFWATMGSIVLVVLVLSYGFFIDPKLVPSPLVGKPAPLFTTNMLVSGEKLSLQDLRGQPVVLNFWASWCVACRDEAAVLEHAYQVYGPQGLRVIGIAIQDTPEKALAFAQRFGKTYTLALDNNAGEIGLNYGLYGVPETFFIDREGLIRYKHVGAVTPDMVATQAQQLLQN